MKRNINMNFIGKHLQLIDILLLTVFVGAAVGLYFDVPARLQGTSVNERPSQPYTCPMHPEVLSDQPGNCPKCGMALTAVFEAENSNAHGGCGAAEQHGCCPKPEASKLTLPPGHPPIDMPQTHAGCAAASETAPSPATSSK